MPKLRPLLRCRSQLPTAPVAGGQGVAQAIGDGGGLDGAWVVDLLAFVERRLHLAIHVLQHLAEEHSEQVGQQGSSHVQPFVAEVVTIVLVTTVDSHLQAPPLSLLHRCKRSTLHQQHLHERSECVAAGGTKTILPQASMI